MFCGIGGFRLGFEKASKKYKTVWANDIDKYACQVYRKNFGSKELVEGDITKIGPNTIPNFDILTAGFPCQSFSLAGKREGFRDIRGTMFFEVVRIAGVKRPKMLLLENVKGLLSADKGYCFWRILEVLSELGYDVEYQILNSKYFGVPQNRERVFIIGYLRTEPTRQIFPITEANGVSIEARGTSQVEGVRFRVANSLNCSGSEKERNLNPLIANTLSHRYGKDGSENLILQKPKVTHEGKIHDCGRSSISERVYDKNGSSVALTTQIRGVPKINTEKIRRLTPMECERLQGFPDGWTEGVSDTQRYKLLGNTVTVNVIEFLAKRILEPSLDEGWKRAVLTLKLGIEQKSLEGW